MVIEGYPSDDDSPGGAAEWDALDFRLVSNAENSAEAQHSNNSAHGITIESEDAIGNSRSAPHDVGAFVIPSAFTWKPKTIIIQ